MEEKCKCDETCECGCQEGKECTCKGECHHEEKPKKEKKNKKEEELKSKIKELEEALLRKDADLINYRKRKGRFSIWLGETAEASGISDEAGRKL